MRIAYFDLSGRRGWASFREAAPLSELHEDIRRPDVVFIHLSDFQNADEARALISVWATNGRIGDGTADLVFLSGAAAITRLKKDTLKNVLRNHRKENLFFYQRTVPHGVPAADLETHFGAYIDARYASSINPDASLINADDFFVGPTDGERAAELSAAFRMLWETYLVATTARLKPSGGETPLAAPALEFDDTYWAPVLKDGVLDPLLLELGDDDVRTTAARLRVHRDWSNIPDDVRIDGLRRMEWRREQKRQRVS